MKNAIKLFGIVTLAAIIGFSMAACGGGGGGGDDGSLGENLNISLKAYLYHRPNDPVPWQAGDIQITTKIPGIYGQIKGDTFTFSMGPPSSANMELASAFVANYFTEHYTYVSSSPSDAKVLDLWFIGLDIMGSYSPDNTGTEEQVGYLYFDKDCTVQATGVDYYDEDGIHYIVSNVYLDFKRGWNAITFKEVFTETTITSSINMGKPSSIKAMWTGPI
jgi:hypothetical protein